MSNRDWYRDGLRFGCTRCGHCCSGESGAIRISHTEVDVLARRFDVSSEELRAMYTRPLAGGQASLRERPGGECIFFSRERGCTVYEDRPRQCRSWPFWRGVVATPERWAEEAKHCPGMNRGALLPADSIRAIAASDGTSGTVPPPAKRG